MEIINFLICDDIRSEIGNKHSLIGTYDDIIEFNVTPDTKDQWPKAMRLGIFSRIIFDENDKSLTSFKLKADYNGDVKEIGQGILPAEQIIKTKRITLAAVYSAFVFKEAGNVKFIFDFYNDKNEFKVNISPDFILKVSEKLIPNT